MGTKSTMMLKFGTGLLSALGAVCMAVSPAAAYQEDGTIQINLLFSTTGAYASYGVQPLAGVRMAIDDINAAGGIEVDGRKVKLVVAGGDSGYDAGADPSTPLPLIKKAVLDDGSIAIVGLNASSLAEVAFNYLNELDKQGTPITLLSPAVASPGLGKISPWGFRNSFLEREIIPREIKALRDAYGIKTAAIFVLKDNVYYPTTAEKTVTPALKDLGIELVATADATTQDRDLSRQVQIIKEASPDLLVVMGQVVPSVNFMKEASRRGLTPKVWLGGIAQLSAETVKIGGSFVDGLIVGSSFDPQSAQLTGLAGRFRSSHGQDLSVFVIDGYDTVFMLKKAIEAAGIKNVAGSVADDRKKVRDALEKISIESITGEEIRFNADHDVLKQGFILQIKDGKYQVWKP